MAFTVGSVFSGIGGTDLAFERAGAEVLWFCEIDAACRRVLQRHWPGTPRFKDVKTVTGRGLGAAGLRPDCLVGGFPCQDLSVAGARAGLAGERSGLFFEFARLLEEVRPQWFLLENVPGMLSAGCKPPCPGGCVRTHGGAMGAVVGTLVDLGYGLAWRVLDAQYFGVAQRRRRVFIVGHLGDAARAREVLLVGEGGGGDPPARRAARESVAGSAEDGAGGGGEPYTFDWQAGGHGDTSFRGKSRIYPVRKPGLSGALQGNKVEAVAIPETVQGLTGSFGNGGADDNKAQAGWLVPAVSNALVAPSTGGHHFDPNGKALLPVAYRKATTSHGPENDWERWEEAEHTNTLDAGSNVTRNAHAVVAELAVRRLTPLECLRLQGFPDDWLDGLGLADSVKYRCIGNAVAVPVVAWIAARMER